MIRLTESEYEELLNLVPKQHRKYPAVFACNGSSQVWPQVGPGHSPESLRKHLEGKYPKLDEMVYEVLKVNKRGANFGVNRTGVYLLRDKKKIVTVIVDP